MAYTDIDKPEDYFNTVLYTGNGSTQSITGVGFQPDWVWLKKRNASDSHYLQDAVRGVTKAIKSNSTDAEATDTDSVTSFNSDGFSLGNSGGYNSNTNTFVAWNWLASNTTASNTDGSITSTVSANTTSRFSIVSWNPTTTSTPQTIGHGLGVAPSMMIVRNRDVVGDWRVYHSSIGATKALNLNTTDAQIDDNGFWNDVEPTSSVFTTGNGYAYTTGGSTDNYIAYCFAEKKGFSKFGSYTGNGNADGTFVYTGFKPAWVMIKRTDSANSWTIRDSKRSTFNVMQKSLFADLSNAEADNSNYNFDFLSNGFKQRNPNGIDNASGGTYIYMAFASNPFVTSLGIPTTAR